MFCRGDHVRIVNEGAGTLETLDCGDANARHQKRVLAVGLFGTSPARITSEIEYGGQALLSAAGAYLRSGRSEYIMNQRRIPG